MSSNFERGVGVGQLLFQSYDDVKGLAGKIFFGTKMFILFTLLVFISSLFLIHYGGEENSRNITLFGVILEAISAFILATIAAAIGAIFGSKGMFRFVQIFFIYRMIIALMVLAAPDFADFSNVGIILFASCILGLLSAGAGEKGPARAFVWIIMIGAVLGMYIPNLPDMTSTGLGKFNNLLATSDLAQINRNEIDNRTFEFYNSNGKSPYWYCVTPDRKIEIYIKGGYEKTYRIKRYRMDQQTSDYILANGSGVISPRNFDASGSNGAGAQANHSSPPPPAPQPIQQPAVQPVQQPATQPDPQTEERVEQRRVKRVPAPMPTRRVYQPRSRQVYYSDQPVRIREYQRPPVRAERAYVEPEYKEPAPVQKEYAQEPVAAPKTVISSMPKESSPPAKRNTKTVYNPKYPHIKPREFDMDPIWYQDLR